LFIFHPPLRDRVAIGYLGLPIVQMSVSQPSIRTKISFESISVSRTRKDSAKTTSKVLEIIKRADGTFDLLLNRKPDRGRIPEEWLPEELCVRFGFCCEEYDSILCEVNRNGKKAIFF
jgi:hypothetical protein